MFDIDWMAGMSAGVFTLQNSDVKEVMKELEKIVGDRNTSPITGILKIVPIERMNAILVVTPQPAYLDEVKKWIERLDRSSDVGGGLQFFVYHLQNTRAERLGAAAAAGVHRTRDAAARRRRRRRSRRARRRARSSIRRRSSRRPRHHAGAPPRPPPWCSQVASQAARAAQQGTGIVRNLQVVADKDANTLLFIATAAEYAVIEQALRKLDVPQRQVVIEVTIAEVDAHRRAAVRRRVAVQGRRAVRPRLGRPRDRTRWSSAPSIPRAADGRRHARPPRSPRASRTSSTTRTSRAASRRCCSLLDTYGNTKVVANPHVAALDNQKATIKSGDRIPINQQTNLVGGTDQRRHDDVAVHRHRRAAAGDAPHQCGRPRLARRPGRGQRSRATARAATTARRRSTRARCRPTSPCRAARRWSWAGSSATTRQNTSDGPAAAVAHPDPRAASSAARSSRTTAPSSCCSSRRGWSRTRSTSRGVHRRPAPPDGEHGRPRPAHPAVHRPGVPGRHDQSRLRAVHHAAALPPAEAAPQCSLPPA